MPNPLRRNIGLKITCVGVAILLYFVANNQINPQTQVEMLLRPRAVNVPAGYMVSGEIPAVPVTVTGNTLLVDGARKRLIPARVDLRGARAGKNRVLVEFDLPDGLRRRTMMGEEALTATVTLDKVESVAFVVDVLHDDTAIAGFQYADAVTTPRRVTVSGRLEDVKKVSRVIADVQGAADRNTIDRTVSLTAQDAQKRTVDAVTITPESVRVRVDLERALSEKRMLLSLERTGKPTDGYELFEYAFSPPIVSVRGSQEDLAARSSLDVRVDVTGMTQTETRRVRIVPPSGLAIASEDTVRVRLEIRRIAPPIKPPVAPTQETPVPAANQPLPRTEGKP